MTVMCRSSSPLLRHCCASAAALFRPEGPPPGPNQSAGRLGGDWTQGGLWGGPARSPGPADGRPGRARAGAGGAPQPQQPPLFQKTGWFIRALKRN